MIWLETRSGTSAAQLNPAQPDPAPLDSARLSLAAAMQLANRLGPLAGTVTAGAEGGRIVTTVTLAAEYTGPTAGRLRQAIASVRP